jgi:hypothetical protein
MASIRSLWINPPPVGLCTRDKLPATHPARVDFFKPLGLLGYFPRGSGWVRLPTRLERIRKEGWPRWRDSVCCPGGRNGPNKIGFSQPITGEDWPIPAIAFKVFVFEIEPGGCHVLASGLPRKNTSEAAVEQPWASGEGSPVAELVKGRQESRGAAGRGGDFEGVGQADEFSFAPGSTRERQAQWAVRKSCHSCEG